jgi:predicted GNAT family acetyltransferase
MLVREVTEQNLEPVRLFLEAHSDTTMFLLSNLATHGHKLGDGLNSGNFRYVEESGEIVGVFCLTRRGNLLLETGGRSDLADLVVRSCSDEPFSIQGVVGEWRAAKSIWNLIRDAPGFRERYQSREVLYARGLSRVTKTGRNRGVRRLVPSDSLQWESLNAAYLGEQGLPIQGTAKQRRAAFEESCSAGRWWGYPQEGPVVAIAAVNAVHRHTGQVAGVYTVPQYRRTGLARLVMEALMEDAELLHHLNRLILFTGEDNRAARGLYESLGFTATGHFALLFGEPVTSGKTADAQQGAATDRSTPGS